MDKESFKNKAKNSIDEIFAKIEDLEIKKNEAKADVKETYEKKLAELKSKKSELQKRYDDLLHASEDKWEEVKNAFTSSSESFKEGFSKIASLFKKKND